MSDLHFKTIAELAAALAAGETTSVAITQAVLDRTAVVEERVKAFIAYDADDALAQARASDARRAAGEARGPLDGIPVGIKDTLAVQDQPLRCASKAGALRLPLTRPALPSCAKRVRLIYGRLNMDEFAMGSSTENSACWSTANPWDLDTIPGGSSGGGAGCAGRGGGDRHPGHRYRSSIRQPAALCGVVGMKPTYGLISRYGLVAFASSLDQVGPLPAPWRMPPC